ncbi:MAG: cytochrome P450 [Acidimicrobiales bacterium]
MMLQAPRALSRWHRKYGDRFTVRLGPLGKYVFLADPEDIKTVFHGDDTVFHAGEANAKLLERVLGESSVLVTDENVHLRQHRRLAGPFHGESVARLAPLMAEIAAGEIETWPVGSEFSLWPSLRAIALDVILRTVIGTSDEGRLIEERQALTAILELNPLRIMQFLKPALSNYWPWSRYRRIEQRADALLYQEIESCMGDPNLAERRDVLAMLVRQREADGQAMTAGEIRDQLITLLLAGHETTATALAWTFERIVRHPAVMARATEAARVGDSAYLDAVITETLRVRPIISDVNRRLTHEIRLGPYMLPPGTSVDPAIILVQRSPRHYPDPLRFDPQRFVGSRPDQTIWLPFGGGNRRCLGAAFALTEMRVVLTEVLSRVELATTTARDERPRARLVTMTPHAGARVTVLRRLTSATRARGPESVAGSEVDITPEHAPDPRGEESAQRL